MDCQDAADNRGILNVFSFDEPLSYDSLDWSAPSRPEPITIYCSAESAPRVREMLYKSFVEHWGCPPDIAREYVYGPPPPEAHRPDPVRIALLFNEVPAQEVLREMAHSLAKSVAVIGHVGSSCANSIRAINQALAEEQHTLEKAKLDQLYFEEYRSFKLSDFPIISQLAAPVDPALPEAIKPQKQRGKGRRGHNSDRDRVIGGKAGYC